MPYSGISPAMGIKITITVEKSRRLELRVERQAPMWCAACGEQTTFALIGRDAAAMAELPPHIHVITDADQTLFLCLRSLAAG